MADLSYGEKRKLERILGMGGGYVLNFTNRTFDEFMYDAVNVNIYEDKYGVNGDSKANRMRTFWMIEPNYIVAKVLEAIISDFSEFSSGVSEDETKELNKISVRLKEASPIPAAEAIKANADDEDFEKLAKSVQESINRNEPETGLDRLHTYLVKYFRNLCIKHSLTMGRDKPLHSLAGEYIKALEKKGAIETTMTQRILKGAISIFDEFNRIRNDHSFAHDNKILNYEESLLIFRQITSIVHFIDQIESKLDASKNPKEVEIDWDS